MESIFIIQAIFFYVQFLQAMLDKGKYKLHDP